MDKLEQTIQQMQQLPELLDKFSTIMSYVANLEQGIVALATESRATGLINKMIVDLLVEKGVTTSFQIDKLLEEKVNKPMIQFVNEANARIQQKADSMKQQTQVGETKEEEEEEVEDNSNVVLASERFKSAQKDEE